MGSQRGHLLKRNYFFAFLILIIGFGGLLGYDLYFKPYVLSQTVVKVKVAEGGFLPKNYELKVGDLYLDSVQTKDIPSGVITEVRQVEHKITNVNLMDGSILTESLVDVSDLEPQQDEGIFLFRRKPSLQSTDRSAAETRWISIWWKGIRRINPKQPLLLLPMHPEVRRTLQESCLIHRQATQEMRPPSRLSLPVRFSSAVSL